MDRRAFQETAEASQADDDRYEVGADPQTEEGIKTTTDLTIDEVLSEP